MNIFAALALASTVSCQASSTSAFASQFKIGPGCGVKSAIKSDGGIGPCSFFPLVVTGKYIMGKLYLRRPIFEKQ